MQEQDLDAILAALAHPVRRQLVDRIVEKPGDTLASLADGFQLSRIAILKHLKVLEAARLVISHKQGRQRRHYFNGLPLAQVVERWTTAYSRFWAGRMLDVKERVESRATQTVQRKAQSA